MVGYFQLVLSVVLALIIVGAGYQALFGPDSRSARAERVLRIALAPAVLGVVLGLPPGQEIVEWVTTLVDSLAEVLEIARADR